MPKSLILANHLYIALYASGTSDADNLPAAANAAWIKAGHIGSMQVTRDVQKVEVMAPFPGRYRRAEVIEYGSKIDFLASVRQGGPLLWQMLFGTNPLTAGSNVQYNPEEGGQIDGWIKLQQYSTRDDSLQNTVVQYCHLQIGGAVSFAEQLLEYQILGEGLHSTLNSGTLPTLV